MEPPGPSIVMDGRRPGLSPVMDSSGPLSPFIYFSALVFSCNSKYSLAFLRNVRHPPFVPHDSWEPPVLFRDQRQPVVLPNDVHQGTVFPHDPQNRSVSPHHTMRGVRDICGETTQYLLVPNTAASLPIYLSPLI